MKVLISGGGTGGHIFPALAIANAIKAKKPDTEFLFVGASNRMEMERVPAAGYNIEGLTIAGFDRKRLWRNFKVLWLAWKATRKAKKILKDFQPDVAIGVGGYVSGPVLKAAQKKGIPTLLQEQNSYAGVTNKLLAKKARHICVAYDGMERFFPKEAIQLTGNPIRSDLLNVKESQAEAKKALGFDPNLPLIAVVGGSLGARTINEAISVALPKLTQYQVLWQTGKNYYDQYKDKAAHYHNVQAKAFLDRMDLVYRAADLIVSRAGASTISELQVLGKPSILVPSPNVAEDHQRKNAEALSSRDAAVMILDKDATEKLGSEIYALISEPDRLKTLGENAKKMALPNADNIIADLAIDLAQGKQRSIRHKDPQTPSENY